MQFECRGSIEAFVNFCHAKKKTEVNLRGFEGYAITDRSLLAVNKNAAPNNYYQKAHNLKNLYLIG